MTRLSSSVSAFHARPREPATAFSASAATQPRRAVEELPRDVQMPGMPRRLLDHVPHDPTNIRRLESTGPVLAHWWRRKWGCRQHRLGLRALVAVEGDDLRECRRSSSYPLANVEELEEDEE